ncbi:hypothetical protein ACC745_38490, partial [Rhizobium ruizarguesonis]
TTEKPPARAIPGYLYRSRSLDAAVTFMSDETGDYISGSYIVNAPGSEHSVWSDTGCMVLIEWDRPVKILEEEIA